MLPSFQSILFPQADLNFKGRPRRVGIEIEMNGLSLNTLSELVAEFLSLQVVKTSRYQYHLTGDSAGDWIIELDFKLLKEMGEKEPQDPVNQDIENLLKLVSKPLVPHELISPPLPIERLIEVQTLISVLREAGAKGTSESVLNAFSLQLNPDVPSLEPRSITAYLKAFLCLYDWLHTKSSVDMTRRITPYVDPFPSKYVNKVLADDYWPTNTTQLINDYLVDNPTRNRALDLLPLFTFIDPQLVRSYTKDPLIKPRPALHYRLPNCEIHVPDWGLHFAWNGWLQVEALANDEERLRSCAKEYLRLVELPWWQRMLRPGKSQWVNKVEADWIIDLNMPL